MRKLFLLISEKRCLSFFNFALKKNRSLKPLKNKNILAILSFYFFSTIFIILHLNFKNICFFQANVYLKLMSKIFLLISEERRLSFCVKTFKLQNSFKPLKDQKIKTDLYFHFCKQRLSFLIINLKI